MRHDPRTLTAYHEAGHAVLGAALFETPHHVSIRADAHTLGRSRAAMPPKPTLRAQIHLAGFAAEHLLTGRRPRQLAQEVGFAIMARLDPALAAAFAGAEDRDGQRTVLEVSRTALFASDDALAREVDRLYDIARASLRAVWPAVTRLADALLENETLNTTD